MTPTKEQITVGCEVVRAKINAKMGNFSGYVTDADIREIVIEVLTATGNVLGGEEA